jgi:multiple sugar transport system substrate-binding protein
MSAHPITRRGALSAAAILGLPSIRRSHADTPVSLISHRYPGLEYYADKIKTALPGVPVDARLMQAPGRFSSSRISLSARSNQMDLVWANNIVLASFTKSGWLEPLDDLWAKHAQEFNLNDISPTLVKAACMMARFTVCR